MPFLVPALLALASDLATLYLNRLNIEKSPQGNENLLQYFQSSKRKEEEDSYSEEAFYFWVGYLAPLALIRIVLLLLPLLFHSYTGTAIRCPKVYQILYYGTLVVLALHMLVLLLLNPQSLESIIPWEPFLSNGQGRFLLQHFHALRRIWCMLICSLLSNSCHLILLQHVKSTAPTAPWHSNTKQQQQPQSVYFAIRSNVVHDDTDHQDYEQHAEPALVIAVNEFLVDVQIRMRRTKQEWTKRLDDFTRRVHEQRGLATIQSSNSAVVRNQQSNTPFRALLHLFADQDVLTNGRLSAAFDSDDGQSMTFLVPQLLTFLLHGATTCSQDLEEWILEKCEQHILFAHRCYWFLRAWCLEVPGAMPSTPMDLSRPNSEAQLPSLLSSGNTIADLHFARARTFSGSSIVLEPLSPQPLYLDQPARSQSMDSTPIPDEHQNDDQLTLPKSSSARNVCLPSANASLQEGGGNVSVSATNPQPNFSDKFLPQERAMIERLMLRVKERGEMAARVLEYGQEGEDFLSLTGSSKLTLGGGMSPSQLMQVVEKGAVPIDVVSGRPSQNHLDSLAAPHKYGFRPFLSFSKPQRTKSDDSTEQFDKTPQFLDALIYIAEWLFTVPRELRKEELHNMLRQLECELLPGNCVYLPSRRIRGSVWRIAVAECLPISTKQRVPCILAFEVVQLDLDYFESAHNNNLARKKDDSCINRPYTPMSFSSSTGSNHNSSIYDSHTSRYYTAASDVENEAQLVKEWTTRPRNPLRLVPLINKVADSMKGTMDRVKLTVKERLSDLVMPDEFKSLTNDSDDDESSFQGDDVEYKSTTVSPSYQTKLIPSADDGDVESGGLIPMSSVPETPTMGQWSSPVVTPASRRAKGVTPTTTPTPTKASPTSPKMRRKSDAPTRLSMKPGPYGSGDDNGKVHGSTGELSSITPAGGPSLRAPPVVFPESWQVKQERVRRNSAYGSHPGWQLVPVLIKANDDLRQEELASQLIYRMASILAQEKVPVWLCPYEIIALTDRGGIIEAIPDTISIDSLKKNNPNYNNLRTFFIHHFGEGTEDLSDAKANFVESLAAYSMVCFLLQIKDRHNGNILIDSRGHVIHIDFGFFFLSSPGKNAGFESAPFKLTRDFMEVMDGPHSHLFHVYRELCVRSFLALRKHCMEILLLVEMLQMGNERLGCFCGRPAEAIEGLKSRFRLDLNDRACREYVHALIDDSMENWRTAWYDRYQRYFVGVL